MSEGRRIFLGMPTYGQQTAHAGAGFWRACANTDNVFNAIQCGSLLASNFNQLWCSALNIVRQGGQVDYFAMLHDDIGPLAVGQDGAHWLDILIDELESKELDVLGVVVPIKDSRGMTSLALHNEAGDSWMPYCRLSMQDVFDLPETFTSDDLGHPLLLNTGCWVCKFDIRWADKVCFTINDRIVFNRAADRYQSQTEPEDWGFSRQLHEIGSAGSETEGLKKLRIGATRKVKVIHSGRQDFQNVQPWGTHLFDLDVIPTSPVPGAFPRDIHGWLTPDEGKALSELATDKDVLEIGSYCGLSTVCLARTAKHVTAVDYFDGRGTPVPENTLDSFQDNIKRYGVADKIAIANPDDDFTGECDLLYIDGAHDYESVSADIHRYSPMLREGGLIAFHDYDEPGHPGVTESVNELLAAGGEIVSVIDHLAVVKPPVAIPLEI